MKYYLIAGERSGDLHGSNLIKALKKEDPDAKFRGFGGDYMTNAGAEIVIHYKEMAVMGLVEVLKNIFKIKKFLSLCHKDISAFEPDAIIFIDFAGFNLRIAERIQNLNANKFYYISPKIWAWNQKRAYKIKNFIDKTFVILPFEVDFYSRFDVDAKYVGNPVMDAINEFQPDSGFLSKHKIIDTDGIVALLPGSRKQEVLQLLPRMIEVARKFPGKTFGLSIIRNLPQELYEDALKEPNMMPVIEDNYNLLLNSEAAIVTSGTATLETALFEVPQVVVYRTSRMNYAIGKRFVKVDHISLVNLIVNKEIVKELIQEDVTAHSISKELEHILEDEPYRTRILNGYKKMRGTLKGINASGNTAKEIFELVSARKSDFIR
ncbi:MAG: lipid-A-disaccharide synthase [Cytophagales bacterium]|nr:lipid-A-disaccharide synthase [Cytophagales bacterium]